MISQAIILAAGFGLRARPLSEYMPKPLFPVLNKPMLEMWIERLLNLKIERIVVNCHYMAPAIIKALEDIKRKLNFANCELFISQEKEILGTGGALTACQKELNSNNFYLINADIYSDLDLQALGNCHLKNNNALATLALLNHETKANVSLNSNGNILGFRLLERHVSEAERLAYSGVMVLNKNIFSFLTAGFGDLIDALNQALAGGHILASYCLTKSLWSDIGDPKEYWQLNKLLANGQQILSENVFLQGKSKGFVIAGANSCLEKKSFVENSVLWPGAIIRNGDNLKNAIVFGDSSKKQFIAF